MESHCLEVEVVCLCPEHDYPWPQHQEHRDRRVVDHQGHLVVAKVVPNSDRVDIDRDHCGWAWAGHPDTAGDHCPVAYY